MIDGVVGVLCAREERGGRKEGKDGGGRKRKPSPPPKTNAMREMCASVRNGPPFLLRL